MAGTERLKEKILSEARLKADSEDEQASREAETILGKAKKEAQEIRTVILSRASKEASAREKRMISVSELEGRKSLLTTKQEIIEDLFSKAVEKLNLLPSEEYEKILTDMICASATGNEEIILSRKDRSKISAAFIDKVNKLMASSGKQGALKLSSEARSINGGFILKTGNIEINNSFETIIATQKDDLETLAVKMLF